MSTNENVPANRFSDHCSINHPYFCLFHSQGSAPHSHSDFYEFCFVISGTYYNTYKGNTTPCQTGDVIFFKVGEEHSFLHDSESCNHYAFTIQQHFFEDFVRDNFENYQEILDTSFTSIKLSGPQFAYLSHLASSIARSYSPDKKIIGRQFFEALVYNCFNQNVERSPDSASSYAQDLLHRFNNFQLLNVRISDIYKEYPVSQSALIHSFRASTGHSIVNYRAIKRMEYAAHLLAEENYPISIIAEILNISSPTYFSQQFKRTYGVSPKNYQLLHRSGKNTTKEDSSCYN